LGILSWEGEEEMKLTDSKYITYVHHRKKVWVKKELKGKHREYCLCFSCKKFNPTRAKVNCIISNCLYKLCSKYFLVTPVFECPYFEARQNKASIKREVK
jgi:hypothetical protein